MKASEITISYRPKKMPSEMPKVENTENAFDILAGNIDIDDLFHKEKMHIMLLNNDNRVLGIAILSQGGINGTICDVRILFQHVIKTNAVAFILFHNHPSGNLKPSRDDVALSKKIEKGSRILDVSFLDHIIISPEKKYRSMRANDDF